MSLYLSNLKSGREISRPDWTKSIKRNPDQLWLDKNENPDPILSEHIKNIASSIPSRYFYSYPDLAPLYYKLAEHLDVSPYNLLLSHGSDAAISSIFEAFISNGDGVLITKPTFAMYEVYSKIYEANTLLLNYLPSKEGPILKLETILSALKKHKPKLFCLPNPDSPTGHIFQINDIEEICKCCKDTNTILLIDEAYYPVSKVNCIPLLNKFENLIVIRTTAKAWGMAGLRMGFAVSSKKLIIKLHNVRPMYETNNIGAFIFDKMLDNYQKVIDSVNRLNESKSFFAESLIKLGYEVFKCDGNFILVKFGDKVNNIDKCLENKVLYRKVAYAHPSLCDYSRFSLGTIEQMDYVLSLIR